MKYTSEKIKKFMLECMTVMWSEKYLFLFPCHRDRRVICKVGEKVSVSFVSSPPFLEHFPSYPALPSPHSYYTMQYS